MWDRLVDAAEQFYWVGILVLFALAAWFMVPFAVREKDERCRAMWALAGTSTDSLSVYRECGNRIGEAQ